MKTRFRQIFIMIIFIGQSVLAKETFFFEQVKSKDRAQQKNLLEKRASKHLLGQIKIDLEETLSALYSLTLDKKEFFIFLGLQAKGAIGPEKIEVAKILAKKCHDWRCTFFLADILNLNKGDFSAQFSIHYLDAFRFEDVDFNAIDSGLYSKIFDAILQKDLSKLNLVLSWSLQLGMLTESKKYIDLYIRKEEKNKWLMFKVCSLLSLEGHFAEARTCLSSHDSDPWFQIQLLFNNFLSKNKTADVQWDPILLSLDQDPIMGAMPRVLRALITSKIQPGDDLYLTADERLGSYQQGFWILSINKKLKFMSEKKFLEAKERYCQKFSETIFCQALMAKVDSELLRKYFGQNSFVYQVALFTQ